MTEPANDLRGAAASMDLIPHDEPNPKLYEAVLAHPDDDAPRLAYADWFEANGHPGRARFIRDQCREARLLAWGPERTFPELSSATIQAFAHVPGASHDAAALLGSRPRSSAVTWRFLRGFPEWVVFDSFTAMQENHDAVFRYHVRRIGFWNLRSVARLADSPVLARIRELDLSSCNLGDGGLERLALSPHLTQLDWLNLSGNAIGPAGAARLSSAEWLGRVYHLDLGCSGRGPNDIQAAGAVALAVSPHLGRLRELVLDRCGIGDEGFTAMAASAGLRGLTTLSLSHNRIGAAGLEAVLAHRSWPELSNLDLTGNPLGDAGAAVLSRATHWGRVARLKLVTTKIGNEGVERLANASWLANVQVLSVANNPVGDPGAAALASSPHLRSLHSLDLSNTLIGNAGGQTLGRTESLPALRHVNLWGTGVIPVLRDAVEVRFNRQERGVFDHVALPDQPAVSPSPQPLPPGKGPADEEGILAAIAEDPDDDLTRRVHADWLEENGEPELAEVVRRSLVPFPSRADRVRTEDLLQGNRDRWLGPLSRHVSMLFLHGGALRVVVYLRTFRLKEFQAHAREWLRETRVQGLQLAGKTADWVSAAASPVLEAVRELHLVNNELGDAGLAAAVESPHLRGMHTLNVSDNRISSRGIVHLTQSTRLGRLRRLHLRSNHIGVEGLDRLLAWPQVSRLTTLDLGCTSLIPAQLAMLAGCPALAGLRNLNLFRNHFGDSGAAALASSPHLRGLRKLELRACGISAEGAVALAASPHFPNLRILDLGENNVGEEGALALADSPHLSGVKLLVLCVHRVPRETQKVLRRRLGNRVLFD